MTVGLRSGFLSRAGFKLGAFIVPFGLESGAGVPFIPPVFVPPREGGPGPSVEVLIFGSPKVLTSTVDLTGAPVIRIPELEALLSSTPKIVTVAVEVSEEPSVRIPSANATVRSAPKIIHIVKKKQ